MSVRNPSLLSIVRRFGASLSLGVIFCLLLVACGQNSDKTSKASSKSSSSPGESSSAADAAKGSAAPGEPGAKASGAPGAAAAPPVLTVPLPDKTQKGVVTKNHGGDAVDVEIKEEGGAISAGKNQKIRLAGVNAPTEGPPADCFGKEATAFAKTEIPEGAKISLFSEDGKARDPLGRYIAFIWKDNKEFLNEKALRDGYGRWDEETNKGAYVAEMKKAEEEAKGAKRGLWSCKNAIPAAMPPAPPAAKMPPAPPKTELPAAPPSSPLPGPGAHPDGRSCNPFYPEKGVCIGYAPPVLDCKDVSYRKFKIWPGGGPHNFDPDGNDIGCE